MTQKEAVVMALENLGGRSHLKNINLLAIKYIGNNTTAKEVEANIRRIVNSNPDTFRHSEGLPNGWWELTSYQEEMETLKQEIAALKGQLAEKDEIIEQLQRVPTEDAFVERMLKVTKTMFKYERGKADGIRQVMTKMGRDDAEADLDAWIEGRRPQARIKTDKIEVRGNLNAGQVNEIHDNDNVVTG